MARNSRKLSGRFHRRLLLLLGSHWPPLGALWLGPIIVGAADAGAAGSSSCDVEGAVCESGPSKTTGLSTEPMTVELGLLADNETTAGELRKARHGGADKDLDMPGSAARLGLVAVMFGSLLLWIGLLVKYMIDGSLPARLAMWGLLPEVCACISPRSIVALLRMKQDPTPVIVLRGCVTDAGAEELAKGIIEHGPRAGLQAVELPHNPTMGSAGLRRLVAATRAEGVQVAELDLSSNPQLGATISVDLQPAMMAKKNPLQMLKLADCNLSAKGISKLTDLVALSTLRSLDLSYNPLTGAGEHLASAMEAPMLQELVLTCCGLGADDVEAVAEQLPFTSIKSLQLGSNRFGDKGVAPLVEHLPTCQVQELGLEANELTTECLASLGNAWTKRPFSHLRLNGNRMSKEEVAAFVRTLKTIHS